MINNILPYKLHLISKNYDYKPFGDTLWTSGAAENGWKRFNGESKDLESDYMNFGARIYDPEIGRFLSADPLLEAFPNQSPYSYSFNNPLTFRDPSGLAPEKEKGGMRIQQFDYGAWVLSSWYRRVEVQPRMTVLEDLILRNNMDVSFWDRINSHIGSYYPDMGVDVSAELLKQLRQGRLGVGSSGGGNGEKKGAWDIANKWDDDMVEKYRDFAPKQAEMYKNAGKEFTCEDLALQILIDFASQNNLPLSITNGSGTFRPQDFNSIEAFTNTVLGTTGADDLQRYGNTITIASDNISSGDLLLERKDGVHGNHVMMAEFSTNSSLYTIQGNSNLLNGIPGSNKFLRAGYPNSFFYCGKPIEAGRISISNGIYFNFDTNKERINYLNNFNVKALQWNFKKW
ncbi:MAG: hypothetical protein A2X64_05020 [Ignavibacteria bacterium GWF2_33_9]|nr:MAG: hypothetical protein A2X64_05020 [Ignavibacteria bacterium GWF2_33_9]